jgi:drug/metabolite transporter (DMT)-like permease
MILAQLCFAAMNVFTRLGSRHLPWPEIAAARFLIGAGIAVGLARTRGVSLRVTDRRGTWRRSIYGTLAALGAFYATPVTALSSLGAVFTYLLALPLFPERPSPWQLGGSLLVLVATALVGAFTARPRVSLNP